MAIYGVLYRKYLWESNIMENIWVMCGKYLCGFRIMCGLMWVFLWVGLWNKGPKIYTSTPIYTILSSSDICSTTIIIWHLWYSCHNFFYLTFFLHGKLLSIFEIFITIVINWILKDRVFKGKKMSLLGVLLG